MRPLKVGSGRGCLVAGFVTGPIVAAILYEHAIAALIAPNLFTTQSVLESISRASILTLIGGLPLFNYLRRRRRLSLTTVLVGGAVIGVVGDLCYEIYRSQIMEESNFFFLYGVVAMAGWIQEWFDWPLMLTRVIVAGAAGMAAALVLRLFALTRREPSET